jgi:hypothetical protein
MGDCRLPDHYSMYDLPASREIWYLAAHFFELDGSVLKSMSYETVREIIPSDQLRVSSEDSLLDVFLDIGNGYTDLCG